MEEDDMVMREAVASEGRDEPMRREGLQARGIYKEVPRPSRGLALAATKRSLTIINREIYLRYLPIYIFIRV
jgi:hypothetical protein